LAEKDKLLNSGLSSIKKVARIVRAGVLKSQGRREETLTGIRQGLEFLVPVVREGMLASHLKGRYQTFRLHKNRIRDYRFGYDSAVEIMRKRMLIPDARLDSLRKKYGSTAVDVTTTLDNHVEQKALEAINLIIQTGAHISEGMDILETALDAAGVGEQNPWLLETLVRSQIQIAYSAGQWGADHDPDIVDSLWGWRYVTVGDDRVRPNHAALDGTQLPKENSFWQTTWVPNGYNCRCDVIEIFNDEHPEIVEPKAGGGPDEGWGFNAGIVFSDAL
jgi:SPP1 gp7 family putative phage head morphogenesis protein